MYVSILSNNQAGGFTSIIRFLYNKDVDVQNKQHQIAFY